MVGNKVVVNKVAVNGSAGTARRHAGTGGITRLLQQPVIWQPGQTAGRAKIFLKLRSLGCPRCGGGVPMCYWVFF